mmetsp:Transcript_18592/g.43441  ORF Transcript_18592/g.43441 Transcript_18592/m.43441 type:complete len:265 (-) Transcript_18592:168-962(-)
MDGQAGILVLSRCSQAEQLAVRVASRSASSSAGLAIEELRLATSCLAEPTTRLCHFLKQLPLRRLSLRGVEKLSVAILAELLRASPRCQVYDVRFALPLPWPLFGPWLEGLRAKGRQLVHTLNVAPSPSLLPREVIIAQAYSLHCGQIEGCFRFASPGNKIMTGPLSRFAKMFDPPSRYSIMVGCDHFTVDDEEVSMDLQVRSFRVTFWQGEKSPLTSPESQQAFLWQLSLQQDPYTTLNNCWMTDAVVPLDIESLWDGSFLDE